MWKGRSESMVDRAERQGRPRATQEVNLIGQVLGDGEYPIEAVLGQGGMGRVFLASSKKFVFC